MKPVELGKKYDKIADWWHQQHYSSSYGLEILKKAIKFHPRIKSALDVGCGSGGRFINELIKNNCSVNGIDVSERMIRIARENHPNEVFEVQDICTWDIKAKYDFVYAWDSIFHIPLKEHKSVINKLCKALNPNGVLLYTFGNGQGEHTDTWMNDTFYYSTIGINENIKLLIENKLTILHLELDQYPERHAVIIGKLNIT